MDNFKYMSDAKLHRTLLDNGFPNLAVTETTRKILIRKLEKLKMANSKQHCNSNLTNPLNLHIRNYRNLESKSGCPQNTQEAHHKPNMWKSVNMEFTSNKKECSDPSVSNAYKMSYGVVETSSRHSEKINDKNNDQRHRLNHNGMVNRLLRFRGMLQTDIYNKLTSKLQNTESERINCFKTSKQTNNFEDLYSRLKLSCTFKQEIIPHLLIIVLLTFFILLGVVYLSTIPARNVIQDGNTNYNICSDLMELSNGLTEYVNCIRTEDLQRTLALINEIYLHLMDTTETNCVVKPVSLNAFQMKEINHVWIEYLIRSNPDWNLIITDSRGLIKNINGNELSTSNIYFSLTNNGLPTMCVLYNKIHKFFFIIGTGTLIGILFLVLFSIKKYIKSKYDDKRAAVNFFTTEILNNMNNLSNNSDGSYLIINHLRNKLLSVENSTKHENAFKEALRLLKLRDNRLQFGLTMYDGEEVEIIKWTTNNTKPNSNLEKKWQSPAFDNINKIPHPPTPCLKIRHMFDSSEADVPNLEEIIKNAIKYKVGPRCTIHNINVDRKTCCVYVRCASNEDAGIIHNEINGWWFDMRLVSIKFLRLQRYLNRFPDSSPNS